MREIEFRGKRIDNGEWIYGWLRQTGEQDITTRNGQYIRTEKYYQIQDNKYNSQFVNEETIGQYTGLKDKNGKKIFEGDIILYQDWEDGDYFINKGIVEYNEDNCYFNVTERNTVNIEDVFYADNEDLEIIGNIYDDPKLLED